MWYFKYTQMLFAAIPVISLLIGMSQPTACADETGGQSGFEEHLVEFHNGDVKLAGSLLLPKSEKPLPAVIFVHGAGPQTREPYREAAEYFARQGIAALIYDKRGVGKSGGTYESRAPYENLVNDSLAGVGLLQQRSEIASSQIGMWGLSQGASIIAAAASRSDDIQFVVGVGASVADGMMYYYRDNLFRKYGLSETLRDVAEKAQLGQDTLFFDLRDESLPSTFAPKSYPTPEQYLSPEWSQVNQPVLAMWGQLDQHIPVGESVLGLKKSLAHAKNTKWTFIILPRAKHSLGISETGAIQEKWSGYAPGALQTMTDWVHGVIENPDRVANMKLEGFAQQTGVLLKLERYEKLRWYGNGTVQTALFVLFLVSFLANTVAGVRNGSARLFRRQRSNTLPMSNRLLDFKRGVCALNLILLSAMLVVVLLVTDQMHPRCPTILMYLPLLGTVSMFATFVLLVVLFRTRHEDGRTVALRFGSSLEVLCLILFIPYLFYWNLIGYRF
jgi:uncharacterized protein